VKGGELHPARNPRISACLEEELSHSERALVGNVAKRHIADARFIDRVDIGAGVQEYLHDLDVALSAA
jgi:hypothetical protein